jgi:hypothetical protein
MPDFPYVLVPKKLKDFFGHIQTSGVPPKVTQTYLGKVGFKSPNDRAILPVLKHLGFLDGSGGPTERWQAYRNRQRAPGVLASAIRASYADLFQTYPDAHRKDTEALRNYFSAHTKVADRALSAIVTTFKTLCEIADFEKQEPLEVQRSEQAEPVEVRRTTIARESSAGITVNINIQITVPESDKPDVYDKFFAALKKHLIDHGE